MAEKFTTQRMLALRKLTREAADQMRLQLKDVLSGVVPLLNPKTAMGDYVRGSKEAVRGADAIYKEIAGVYETVAGEKPFGVRRELTAPIDLRGISVEVSPLEYFYKADAKGSTKRVLVTSPFRWVLSYSGYAPEQLKRLLSSPTPSNEELHTFVLHYVGLRALILRQAPISKILEALRYSLAIETQPEFGRLPLTCVSGPISTVLPPDEVIIETTEMTGTDAFEEVIDLDALTALRDPLKESLVELAKTHGEKV